MVEMKPYYSTNLGKAYLGDSLQIMHEMESSSINLVLTSPPFALIFKKEYGNIDSKKYVEWFLEYADEMFRVLKDDGSFVLDIGGVWEKGRPTRSLYQYELVLALCKKIGFFLAQDFFWHRPAALPAPAEWVTVRRIRVKDSVNLIFWFSKTPHPKADNRKVLRPYSEDMCRLLNRGYKAKPRPSGHNITGKFMRKNEGSIPSNLFEFDSSDDLSDISPDNFIKLGNNDSNGFYLKSCRIAGIKPHPARFPHGVPEFFIKMLTDEGDTVLDPFAGSNVTGEVAEKLERKWIAIELIKEYLDGSKFRFKPLELSVASSQK
jgi:site-specific DNA-methyltransferase (cytosine-N4-specific)